MKILAVDLGDARTGLAVCDRQELLASPVGVLHEKDIPTVCEQVAQTAREQGAQEVVVGYPLNMNGTVGPRGEKSAQFAHDLQEKLPGIPVRLWDERSTTVSAIGYLNKTDTRGKKRKAVVDAVAATILLESYLNYRKNHLQQEAEE